MATLKYFFFQAEDGIRDYKVTGVQTCALPICRPRRRARCLSCGCRASRSGGRPKRPLRRRRSRSEERRVGREFRGRWERIDREIKLSFSINIENLICHMYDY